MSPLYDTIGASYSVGRREDPRIASLIWRSLGNCRTVINVGAGAGSYEPRDRPVVSVEPSLAMIRQRRIPSTRVIQARAERLPFGDDAFDGALALLTIHHWSRVLEGLAELRRVARRVVILTWDQEVWEKFWMFHYCPELLRQDRERAVPVSTLMEQLGSCEIIPVPVPHDCLDGFQGAFWRRPSAYLSPEVRARMSAFTLARPADYDDGLARLAADIADGTWRDKYSNLLDCDALDLGYRLIVADLPRDSSRRDP